MVSPDGVCAYLMLLTSTVGDTAYDILTCTVPGACSAGACATCIQPATRLYGPSSWCIASWMLSSFGLPKSYNSVLTLYSLPHFDGHRIGKICRWSPDGADCAAADGDGHGMAMSSGRSESSSMKPSGCVGSDWAD